MDLKSTFNEYESVTQITVFKGGEKYTHNNLDPKSIKQGEYTKIRCNKGYRLSINPKNVLFFEIHPEHGNNPKREPTNNTFRRPYNKE